MIEHDTCVVADQPTGASIQAAIDAAAPTRKPVVLLPNTNYLADLTIDLHHSVPLHGAGEESSRITWVGPVDGVLLSSGPGNWGVAHRGFTLHNGNAERGQSIGLLLGGNGPSNGTVGGNMSWDHVGLDGWHIGIRNGGPGGACHSEVSCRHLRLASNDFGGLLGNYNGLDFSFETPSMSDNDVGICATEGACVHVSGAGSASNNRVDFQSQTGGTYSIHGMRSEGAENFLNYWGTDRGWAGLSLVGCHAAALRGVDKLALHLMGAYGATIENCMLGGGIMLHTFQNTPHDSALGLIRSGIGAAEPFVFSQGGAAPRVHYEVKGCVQLDPATNWTVGNFRNEEGYARRSTGRVPAVWIDMDTGVAGSNAAPPVAPPPVQQPAAPPEEVSVMLRIGLNGGVLALDGLAVPVSNGFSPAAIAGLKLWLKADAGAYKDAGSTLAADTETVQQWNDQSGIGSHLSQGTAGARPTLRTNIRNGLPVLRFDGTTDFLSRTLGAALAQPNTVFIVLAPSSLEAGFKAFDGVSSGRHALYMQNSNGTLRFYAGSEVNTAYNWTTGWHVIETVFNGAASLANVDGASIASGVNVGSQTLDGYTIGTDAGAVGSACLPGDIGEVLVYAGALSSGNRALVRSYLGARWGIAVS